MDALLSDQGHGALVIEGESQWWLSPEGELTPVTSTQAERLLNGRGDFYPAEDVTRDDVLRELRLLREKDAAMLLVLTALDPNCSAAVRQRALVAAEELLARGDVADSVQRELYAEALRPTAQYQEALRAASGAHLPHVHAFIEKLRDDQAAIKAVREAWERIPATIFPEDLPAADVLYFAVHDGLLRDVVMQRRRGQHLDDRLLDDLERETRLQVEIRTILENWRNRLTKPRRERRHSGLVRTLGAALPRRTKVGVVVSDKMEKTVVVAVENLVRHGMYQKYIKRTNKFLAHNEKNDARIGDEVMIEETRPLSKRKRWNVALILDKAAADR